MNGAWEQYPERLEAYLREIQQILPLTPEEETRLVQQLARGKLEQGKRGADRQLIEEGEQAQRRLTEATLPVVVRLAQSYLDRRSGLPLMDLIAAGNGGLMRATEGFDLAQGYGYSTYATWWIRQALTRAIASQRSA